MAILYNIDMRQNDACACIVSLFLNWLKTKLKLTTLFLAIPQILRCIEIGWPLRLIYL